MNRRDSNDSWFQRLHRWRLRNAVAVQFAVLALCALVLALGMFT